MHFGSAKPVVAASGFGPALAFKYVLKEQKDALDNLRDSAGLVGPGTGHVLPVARLQRSLPG